jgi:hypothetical protein
MAQTGIPRIDQLFSGQAAAPIAAGEPDRDAVGVIQDFLRGHGFSELPGLLGTGRGRFGSLTIRRSRRSVALFCPSAW